MKISVIIPTYNEEETIEATLDDLFQNHSPDEVIVADGGSTDSTLQKIPANVKLLNTSKGRAVQMNAGAEEAGGDVLLFLHADTLLPKNALEMIRNQVKEKGKQGGRFRLRFDDERWVLRFFASYTRFSCFSYGDQAYFVTKELFHSMGGYFSDVPFEDVDFYKRLSLRTRPIILKDRVITSARRFVRNGCLRQKFINLALVGLAYGGMDVSGLQKRFYPDIR